jgi:hypothetical protein
MTRPMQLVLSLCAAALALGCKSTPAPPTFDTKQQESASVQLARAQADSKAAAQALAEYSYTRKAEFVATMNKELVILQDDLDRLSARVGRPGAATKADAKAKLETVREKLAQTKGLLTQVEGATESTWNGATGGFRQAYASLHESVEEIRNRLRDKMAP